MRMQNQEDKREFTGVIVVSGVSPSVSFADSSLVRGSLELPPSDEGGGATEKRCLSVASEGEITVNNHFPHEYKRRIEPRQRTDKHFVPSFWNERSE